MIKKIIKDNLYISVIFVIVTSFFIMQHALLLSWDFSSYVMNSQYMFSGGDYFEVYRAPLTPLLLSTTHIFGAAGEYIYILQVSIIFLFACILFADTVHEIFPLLKSQKKEFVRFVFYITMLSPFTIFFGLQGGTELLTLSFLIIFLAELLKGNSSGYLLALGFLTRYNLILFTPFLILNRNYKKIIKNILGFVLVVSPWFIYNFYKFGNFFTSLVDSYALNIFFRSYVIEPFKINAPFEVIGLSLAFAIFGLTFAVLNPFLTKKIKIKEFLISALIIFIAAVIIKDYSSIPFKITRYLYNLALPSAFFVTLGISLLSKIGNKTKTAIIIILIFLFSLQTTALFQEQIKARDYDGRYHAAAQDLVSLGLENCLVRSPHWVPIKYLSGNAIPLGDHSLYEIVATNQTALIFRDRETYDDSYNPKHLDLYDKIYETNDYIFIGNHNITPETCAKRFPLTEPYTNQTCEILSEKFDEFNLRSLSLKTCQIINFQKPTHRPRIEHGQKLYTPLSPQISSKQETDKSPIIL